MSDESPNPRSSWRQSMIFKETLNPVPLSCLNIASCYHKSLNDIAFYVALLDIKWPFAGKGAVVIYGVEDFLGAN